MAVGKPIGGEVPDSVGRMAARALEVAGVHRVSRDPGAPATQAEGRRDSPDVVPEIPKIVGGFWKIPRVPKG